MTIGQVAYFRARVPAGDHAQRRSINPNSNAWTTARVRSETPNFEM